MLRTLELLPHIDDKLQTQGKPDIVGQQRRNGVHAMSHRGNLCSAIYGHRALVSIIILD